MKRVSLEQFGRQLVELRETAELRTAIPMQMECTLRGIAAENQALLRRDACQNRDLDELRGRLDALETER